MTSFCRQQNILCQDIHFFFYKYIPVWYDHRIFNYYCDYAGVLLILYINSTVYAQTIYWLFKTQLMSFSLYYHRLQKDYIFLWCLLNGDSAQILNSSVCKFSRFNENVGVFHNTTVFVSFSYFSWLLELGNIWKLSSKNYIWFKGNNSIFCHILYWPWWLCITNVPWMIVQMIRMSC